MGRKPTLKHTIAVLSLATVLAASLTACGGSDAKATLPVYTGGTSPSATTTSPPATTAPAASAGGPVVLAPHTTYTYGGLKVIVDQPASIPSASRPAMRLFSDFLRAIDRTTAANKLDPSLTHLASANVVEFVRTFVVPGSVEGLGSVTYTITKIEARDVRTTRATFCVDQSKVVQVRKDGSRFVDPNARKDPRIKMKADIFRGTTGLEVTFMTPVTGTC
jgi:hypothetical protein